MKFEELIKEIKSWEGIESGPHRFGGIEFRYRGSEIGHLHGQYQADIKFSVALRQELVKSGQANLHHILPKTGWVSFYIKSPRDFTRALELFKKAYDFYVKRR